MSRNKTISILIPVLNEEDCLGKLLEYLNQNAQTKNIEEIICIDGGSTDKTIAIANEYSIDVVHSKKGRAKQMNVGAKYANGDILYFLHADTFPPKGFDQEILRAVEEGYESGCFRMKFDSSNVLLRFFAWLSRINHSICRGGDQSLFIKKELFQATKGFDEAYLIYEDTEFIQRLYQKTRFKVIPNHVITSARKYREKGWLKVQYHFGMIHLKNYMGAGPDELHRYYAKNILN
ncbi:MAG: TIGR04283 family arsenosugar biosynthesis glycosyltransferase [Flavobacteriaceae bacterium]